MSEYDALHTAFQGQTIDLYGEADLMATLERNRAAGLALDPEREHASTLLGQLAAEVTQEADPLSGYDPEALNWADRELGEAAAAWRRYGRVTGPPAGDALYDQDGHLKPNLAPTLTRLFEAKQALTASGEVTPGGENVGDTMHLVLIPWQALKDNLGNLPAWLQQTRGAQGVVHSADYFNDDLLKAIQEHKPLYRNPNNSLLSAAIEYLDHKLAEDGPWGVMLMQTSNEAGTEATKGKSPNELTDGGNQSLVIANQAVDGMGIFEWLSLSLQEDPSQLSSSDYSWLLANRLEASGGPYVPDGRWVGDQVCSRLYRAGYSDVNLRPRLAVT